MLSTIHLRMDEKTKKWHQVDASGNPMPLAIFKCDTKLTFGVVEWKWLNIKRPKN